MSESSPASRAEDDDGFVVHAITSKDGIVETPALGPPSAPTANPLGITNYSDAESFSSSESPSFSAPPLLESTPGKEVPLPNGRSVIAAKEEKRLQHKRVRFAGDVRVAEPATKIPRLESREEKSKAEGDEEDLEEEMALFEAEVGALKGGGDDADIELAEIEDAREEAAQEELRMRVAKMREQLNGVGRKQGGVVTIELAGEKVPLRIQDRGTGEVGSNSKLQENEEEDDGEIDLLADWTEFTR